MSPTLILMKEFYVIASSSIILTFWDTPIGMLPTFCFIIFCIVSIISNFHLSICSQRWSYGKQFSIESTRSGDSGNGSIPRVSIPDDSDADDVFMEDNFVISKSRNGYMKVDTMGNANYIKLDTSGNPINNNPKRVLPKVDEEPVCRMVEYPSASSIANNPGYGILAHSETQVTVVWG